MRLRPPTSAGVAVTALIATTLIVTALLTACTATPSPSGSATSPSPAASGSRSPSASAGPRLIAGGTARENLPYFDLVSQRLIAKGGTPHGRDFVDALVAAGFVKQDMQVTPDTTTVGLNADNIQFSVLIGGGCLIGQDGNIGYASTVQPPLSTGKCLAGRTRTIDW